MNENNMVRPLEWEEFMSIGEYTLDSHAKEFLRMSNTFIDARNSGNAEDHIDSILNKLNVIDELWFGSEAGSTAVFDMLSDILANEPEGYSAALKSGLKSGFSFPKARCEALISYVFSKAHQLSVTEDFLRSFLKLLLASSTFAN